MFWALWYFDALVAAVVVFFFLWGLADGTVSSLNIGVWLAMLAVAATVVGGGFVLHEAGWNALAAVVLLVVAFPGFVYGLFIVAVLVFQPRWN